MGSRRAESGHIAGRGITPVKIALISHGPPDDPRHFSGIAWHILQELRRQGHEVTPLHAEPAGWARSWAQYKNLWSLKFSGQPHHPEADKWVLRTRSQQLNEKIRACGPEAVLCAGFPEAAVAVSATWPLYVWMDALYPTVRRCYAYFQDYYSPRDARVLQQIEDKVLQRTQKIWLSSTWAANESRADFPDAANRIAVQSFGANLAEPPTGLEVTQAITTRNLAEPTLLFLTTEWVRKGGDAAVQTVKQLRSLGCPAKLAVIGLGDRPASVPEEPWVDWVGRLDKNESEEARRLKKYLSESAFLLLPTTADCTPIACHEATAYGLPVLATEVGGLASTVDTGRTGMLWPRQKFVEEASVWLNILLRDRPRYETLAHAARHRFETTGNWAVNVRAVAETMAADLAKK